MLATLEKNLQHKYKWFTELRANADDARTLRERTNTSSTDEETTQETVYLRLQLIVSAYKPTQQMALLAELALWGKQHNIQLDPLFLTEHEAVQFSVFDSSDVLTPYDLVHYYKKQSDYPSNARKQFKRAIDEIKRMLRGLEQEFPTSGLHAWNVGLRLEAIYHQIVSWGLALYDKKYTQSDENWAFFVQHFSHGQTLRSRPTFEQYPLFLHSFLQRHKKLAALAPKTYGDNDLELEQLILPLERATRAIRKMGLEIFSTAAEKERGVRIIWWSVTGISALCICVLLFIGYKNQARYQGAVQLPKKAKTGGITGQYYKGRNFESLRRIQTDRNINMVWRSRPARGLPADHFSVRWKGYVQAPVDGMYRFCGQYDDGAKLWVSSRTVINNWSGGARRTHCKKLYLQKGWHKLKLEFFEHSGPASMRLKWKRPDTSKLHIIPSRYFCCKK